MLKGSSWSDYFFYLDVVVNSNVKRVYSSVNFNIIYVSLKYFRTENLEPWEYYTVHTEWREEAVQEFYSTALLSLFYLLFAFHVYGVNHFDSRQCVILFSVQESQYLFALLQNLCVISPLRNILFLTFFFASLQCFCLLRFTARSLFGLLFYFTHRNHHLHVSIDVHLDQFCCLCSTYFL